MHHEHSSGNFYVFITSAFDSMISNAKFQAPEWLLDAQSVFCYLVSDSDNSFSLDKADVPLTFEQVQV